MAYAGIATLPVQVGLYTISDGCPCFNGVGICSGGSCEVPCTQGSRQCINNPINGDADCCRVVGGLATCKPGGGQCICFGLGTTIDCTEQPGNNKWCCSDGACGNCPPAGPAAMSFEECAPKDFCGTDECGLIDDGCGGTIDCGSCCTPTTCEQVGCGNYANDCVNGDVYCGDCCTPATCESLGIGCGTADDGCGGTIDCGLCAAGQECVDGACFTPVVEEAVVCLAQGDACDADAQCCSGKCGSGRRASSGGKKCQ